MTSYKVIANLKGPRGAQGLPGPGSVPAAEAVGTYLATSGSPARPGFAAGLADELSQPDSDAVAALDTRYPVFRLWDPTALAYPAAVVGALNVYVGPVDPGVVAPEGSRWIRSDAVNLATVASEVLNPASSLYSAVQLAARGSTLFVPHTDFAGASSSVPAAASIGGSSPFIAGWSYANDSNRRSATILRTPPGWNSARISLVHTHDIASPTGTVRWEASFANMTPGSSFKDNTQTRFGTMGVGAQYTVTQGQIADSGGGVSLNPAGGLTRLAVVRRTDSADNTFANPILFLGVILERIS